MSASRAPRKRAGGPARGAGSNACFFCERLARVALGQEPLIYEDPLVQVTHWLDESGSTYRGALLIQTKRHTDGGLPTLTVEEGERIGRLVVQISRALREIVGAAWTYTYCFTEGYRHVHQFVVARYPNTPPKHVRLGITDWKGAPRGNPVEIRQLAQKLGALVGSPTRTGTVG